MGELLGFRHQRGVLARCLREVIVKVQTRKTGTRALLVEQLYELLLGVGVELLGCGGDGDGDEEKKT